MKKNYLETNPDSRANRYALHCFWITMIAFTLAWIMNMLNIFIVDKKTMSIGFVASLIVFAICLILCKIVGLERKGMKYMLLFFIIAITTIIELELTYHAVILSVIPIVYSAMYRDTKRMTIYTYILTIISILIIIYGGYHLGLCDANMALLTAKPLSEYITAEGTFALTQINPNPGLTLFLYFVFPRCVLCGVFVPICINISKIIADSRLKEEEMRMLAEIDGMTGLYNKSKYLEQVAEPYTAEERIAVIYWDVNDLKKINDNYGHELGDELILAVSNSIKNLASAKDRAYRVGGDEFVMILRGGDEAIVTDRITQWKKATEGLKLSNGASVSASVGYACGSGSELEDIINHADKMMYENKRQFHKASEA